MTSGLAQETPPAAGAGVTGRAGAILAGLPDRVLIIALCATLATSITVQLSRFHPYTWIPLFLVLVALTWRLVPSPVSGPGAVQRRHMLGSVVAVLVAVLWVLIQRHFDSELLSVRRDPGIYTLRGLWLMNHSGPDVYLTQQLLDIKKAVPTVALDYSAETGRLIRYMQSTTVVPGLIAVAGWIGGVPLLLQGNVVIGGTALICTYAVGRRMAGPVFGLVPMIALACCMPLAAFSRVAYTEPLSLIAVMACLLGLWEAVRSGRRAMWSLAGVGAGTVSIARIDGWIVIIGSILAIGAWGAAAVSAQARRQALTGLALFVLAMAPTAMLGYTDLKFHSPDYLTVLKPTWMPLFQVAIAVTALAVVVLVVPALRSPAAWLRAHSSMVALVATVVTAALTVAMIARPLYWRAHFVVDRAGQIAVKNRQVNEHLPTDPSRSYDEQSLTWISWYFGWPTVILACGAGLWAVNRAIRERFAPIAVVMVVVAVSAVPYLNAASITPDQIWAMRRFLPVVLPGGLLILGWGLSELHGSSAAVTAGLARLLPGTPHLVGGRAITLLVAAVSLLVAFYPAAMWGNMFPIREGAGQYDMVRKICARVQNQKVLLLGPFPLMGYFQPTLRNVCNATVISLPSSNTTTLGVAGAAADEKAKIARIMSLWGATRVAVITFNPSGPPWTTPPGPPIISDTYQMWESVLSRRPQHARTETTNVWGGTAMADGSVVPG